MYFTSSRWNDPTETHRATFDAIKAETNSCSRPTGRTGFRSASAITTLPFSARRQAHILGDAARLFGLPVPAHKQVKKAPARREP